MGHARRRQRVVGVIVRLHKKAQVAGERLRGRLVGGDGEHRARLAGHGGEPRHNERGEGTGGAVHAHHRLASDEQALDAVQSVLGADAGDRRRGGLVQKIHRER